MHTIKRNDDATAAIAERRNFRNRSASLSAGSVCVGTVTREPEFHAETSVIHFHDVVGTTVFQTGSLSREYALRFLSALRNSAPGGKWHKHTRDADAPERNPYGRVYVVRSYSTPVAWTEYRSGKPFLFVPPVRYSQTTSAHQSLLPGVSYSMGWKRAETVPARSPFGPGGLSAALYSR